MLLEIAKIKATPEAQPRVSLHYPTVEEYAEALRGGAEFPPLVVFYDGADRWLADGFHRLEAYKLCEYVEVPVDVRKGSKRDAILYSVGANARHGLPRTNEDKRRAVMVLIQDAEWGKKSDRWIAEQAAVSVVTVGRIRKDVVGTCNIVTPETREGRDGKNYKLPERRKSGPASEPKPPAEGAEHAASKAQPASERDVEPAADHAPDTVPPSPPRPPPDPKRGCASLSERDAVEAWVNQGAMLYGRFGDGAREYMRTSWDKALAKLEGY